MEGRVVRWKKSELFADSGNAVACCLTLGSKGSEVVWVRIARHTSLVTLEHLPVTDRGGVGREVAHELRHLGIERGTEVE